MTIITIQDAKHLDSLLWALEEQVRTRGAYYELVVIGGTALQALGLIHRPTRDVDILGTLSGGEIRPTKELPPPLAAARDRVAGDFGLPAEWLDFRPADLIELGLPQGLQKRLVSREYGPALKVHFAAREDQIHFKLYAMVDQGGGRHEADLRALKPSQQELLRAANWTRSHDPSEPFRDQLVQALTILGVPDVDLGL